MSTPLLSAPPRWFWWALLGLILTATAARASLQFGTPLAPGINGAYYFVQVRAMLETGTLGVPDLPFTFWLHAGLAWGIQTVSGLVREDAIVVAVKSADSLLPALIAWPLSLLGWRLQASRPNPSALAALAPAALACLGAQALGMTGDFQKNSLALVWLATLGLGAHGFVATPNWRSALLPLGSLALLALTHLGVLGAGAIFAAALGGMAVFAVAAEFRRKLLLVATLGGLIFAAAGILIYHAYDPVRVKRLLRAASDPSTLTASARPHGNRPTNAQRPPRPDFAGTDAQPPEMSDQRPGPGLRGGPPRSGPMQGSRAVALLPLAAIALLAAFWQRKRLTPADLTVISAAALAAAAVGGPWFDGDKAMRLLPMAMVLAAMPLPFLLGLIPWRLVGGLASCLLIAGTAASGALTVSRGGHPTIGENAFEELRALAPLVQPASRTLIVARHGLEWWTAWALHTRIAQPSAVTKDDWTKFDRVLYLVENDGPNNGVRAQHRGQPFGAPLPRRDDQENFDGSLEGGESPSSPDENFAAAQRVGNAPRPGNFRGPGGDAFSNRLPETARILHKGLAITLGQADSPPDSLNRPASENPPPRR